MSTSNSDRRRAGPAPKRACESGGVGVIELIGDVAHEQVGVTEELARHFVADFLEQGLEGRPLGEVLDRILRFTWSRTAAFMSMLGSTLPGGGV